MCNCKEKQPNVRVKYSDGRAYIEDCSTCDKYVAEKNFCGYHNKCVCGISKCPLGVWKVQQLK